MVLGQLCLLALWIFTGNYKQKFKRFYDNKIALVLCSIFFLSLLGLLNTSNFEFAGGDLRRKLHLFSLPFLIASFPALTKKEVLLVFKAYVFWVIFSSLWSIAVMLGATNEVILDKRELSRYNSHIRFGLEICFAIFGSVYYYFRKDVPKYGFVWLIVAAWLSVFLFLSSMFTGIVVLVITTLLLLLIIVFRSYKKAIKISTAAGALVIVLFSIYVVSNSISSFYGDQNIGEQEFKTVTENGALYEHDTYSERKNDKENGYFIWRNIAREELKQAWEKRSKLRFEGQDLKGQVLGTTLVRFLSSKGELKDEAAILRLTPSEIEAIEKGVSNVNYLSMNAVDRRLNKIIWEFDNYKKGRDFNGHSVVMRWAYLKTAVHIFADNFWLGVGTGDLQEAFDTQYNLEKSMLTDSHRLRAHNQYVTYAVSFGVFGLCWILIYLIYPFFKSKERISILYLAFFIIIALSMLTEDTLESQAGIVFFSFFNSILLLQEKKD